MLCFPPAPRLLPEVVQNNISEEDTENVDDPDATNMQVSPRGTLSGR